MNHIKKKYLFQKKIDKTSIPSLEEVNPLDKNLLKKSRNKHLFTETDKGYLIRAFPFNYHGNIALIPIPDLSLVYFDGAYNLNTLRKEKEKELFEKRIVKQERLGEDAINEIYKYYGFASSCIISMFSSLESFINQTIPDDVPYIKKLNHKTEYYNKDQIQRNISFDEKTNKVLPYFFKKNFFKPIHPKAQFIINLKKIRNEIVHPKSDLTLRNQEDLFKRLLNFKYDETIEAVAKFMNHYKPNYIIECDCGVDF